MGFETETQPPAPENPKWMSEMIKVKAVGRAFSYRGQRVEVGAVVLIDKFSAVGLVKMERAIYLDKEES